MVIPLLFRVTAWQLSFVVVDWVWNDGYMVISWLYECYKMVIQLLCYGYMIDCYNVVI